MDTAFLPVSRVIVDDHREQASSCRFCITQS